MAHIKHRRRPGRRPDWLAVYTAPNGRERSKTFQRKIDAERWLTSQESAKLRGEWVDPALGRTTFSAWVAEWETTIVDLRGSTRDRQLGIVRNYLLPHFGATQIARISVADVQAFIAAMRAEQRLAPATVRKVGLVLGKILADATRAGLIARSPAEGVRLPAEDRREMRFLSASQVAELAEAIDPHYRALVYTAAYTGARWGELAGLRPQRVDLLRRQLRIEDQLSEVRGRLERGAASRSRGSWH